MLPLLLALLVAVQDPKPAPKTVEDRLKELGDRLAALEKKGKGLSEENAALEKQIADTMAVRETLARHSGALWVARYSAAVEFTETQSRELEELWYVWNKEDMEKAADSARWKAREESLRTKLTVEQAPRLARKVREEQEEGAKRLTGYLFRTTKLGAEKAAALEAGALRRLKFADGILLVQAHPQETAGTGQIISAIEDSMIDPSLNLTEDERAALQKVLATWKPKQK